MRKVFTSILNKRLLEWSKYNEVIMMQFGFKPRYGTRDAIFAQHSIISKKKTNEIIFCVYLFQKSV